MNNNKENYKNAMNQIHPNEKLKSDTIEKMVQKKKSRVNVFIKYATACAVFAICVSIGAFYVKDRNVHENNIIPETKIAQVEDNLPRFKNMNELKRLEAQRDDEIEIDLGEIFHLLLNKLWVIILCFIVGGVIGFAGTKILVTPQYSASSMIYILPKTRSVTSLADIKMGSQLTSDFGILAKSRPVIEEVNKNLKLDYSYEQLASMVQATNQSDTRILRFTVTDTDPIEAKKIANELANVAAERVAYVMSSDKPKIVEEAAVPKSPSSPNTKKNASVVALVFAFAAAAIIVLRYLLNDTIQNEDDVKKYLEKNHMESTKEIKMSKIIITKEEKDFKLIAKNILKSTQTLDITRFN